MSGSVKKSVANEKIVYGVVVKRLPIGAYLTAIESIRDLPENLLLRLFPDKSVDEAFLQLKHLTTEKLLKIIGRGAAVLPDELLGFFSNLLDVPIEKIRDEMTPSQFMDVICEFWKLNDLSNFIQRVRGAVATLK